MENSTLNKNLANVLETMHKVVLDRENGLVVGDSLVAFEERVSPLSLSYSELIKFQNKTFSSGAHLLLYFKALGSNDVSAAEKISSTLSVKDAARVEIKRFNANDWKRVEYKAVETICAVRLQQSPVMKSLLKSTGTKRLVYASKYDTFFGCGLHITDDNIFFPQFWKGANTLGKIMEKYRHGF